MHQFAVIAVKFVYFKFRRLGSIGFVGFIKKYRTLILAPALLNY